MWIFVEIKDKSFLLHAHKNKKDEFFFVQREKRNRSLKMMKQKTEKIRHS
jgi:hypothetical protein